MANRRTLLQVYRNFDTHNRERKLEPEDEEAAAAVEEDE